MLPSCCYGEGEHRPTAAEVFFALMALVNWGSDVNAYRAIEGYFDDICEWSDDDSDDWCANSTNANVTNASTWFEWHYREVDDDYSDLDFWASRFYSDKSWDEYCGSWLNNAGDSNDDWGGCADYYRTKYIAALIIIAGMMVVDVIWDTYMSFIRWRTTRGREAPGKTKKTKVAWSLVTEIIQFVCQMRLLQFFQSWESVTMFSAAALEFSLAINGCVMIVNVCFLCGMVRTYMHVLYQRTAAE